MYEIISLRDDVTNLPRFKDPVTIGLTVITQALSQLFQGVDPGHWEGNRFIPGDLQSRQRVAAQKISEYGVAQVVDPNVIYDILTEVPPVQFKVGVWQANLEQYLEYLRHGVQTGAIIPGQTNYNPLIPGTNTTGGGFAYNLSTFGNLLPVALIGGTLWYLATHKKKSKKRR